MPGAIDETTVADVDHIWSQNRKESALAIWRRADKELGVDCPSKRWVFNRVKYLKATVRTLIPDPIVEPLSKYWPSDPVGLETLLVLHHEALSLCESQGMSNFKGLTTRMNRWACKISNFFDLSIRLDRLMLLQFTIWFAGQERWSAERTKREDEASMDHYASVLPAISGLMAWHRRNSGPDYSSQERWGHVFPIWQLWKEQEDTVVRLVSHHLAGHIESIVSSTRITPIFDLQQIEDDEAQAAQGKESLQVAETAPGVATNASQTMVDLWKQIDWMWVMTDQQSFISEGQMTAASDEDWDDSKEKVLFDAREKAIQEIVDLIYTTPEGKAAHEQFLRETNIVPRVRISGPWS